MKKQLLKRLALICIGLSIFNLTSKAQCSGGVLVGSITPSGVIQTVGVPNGGSYFTFPAVAGGVYLFTFCAAQGGSATFDTQITIIDDATGLYAGGYNDDWCGLQSYLQWSCPTSGTYRVLVSQYYCTTNAIASTMAYQILPPANDICTGAINVSIPSTTSGSTAFASADVAPSCTTTDGTGGGVWYTFSGDGNQITASLCGTAFDTRMRIYSGSCSGLICEGGNDDFCSTQSQTTFCSLAGTQYYILVHGAGAAIGSFTLNMSEVVVPPVGITQFGYSYCGTGSVTFNASGYSAYNWSPPAGLNTTTGPNVIATPTVTTTYTVQSLDAATGCNAFNNATVTVYPIPVVTASTSNAAVCSGLPTTLSSTGASTYNWMPGSLSGSPVTVNPTSTTTYTVTGTDGNGCSNTNTVTITANPLPTVVASSVASSVCIGSFVTLNSAGASTYVWTPGNITNPNPNVTPTVNTTYTLTGTDVNGCIGTSTLFMTVNPLPTITASASPDTVCTGNTDTLTASGGISYLWSTGHTTNPDIVAPSTLTTYTVTGTDANGCINSGTVTVHALLSGPVTATAAYPTICSGSNEILNASGATNYIWMPGNISGSQITVNPTTNTTYTVTGSNSNGCIKIDSISVVVNPSPTVSGSASLYTLCGGSPSTLTATGATSFVWNPGNLTGSTVTVNPTTTTTYTATGTDANGCSDTAHVSLTITPAPNVTATASSPVVCSGNPTTLTASGASSYVWMPGNLTGSTITVNPTVNTTYTVTGTGVNTCTDSYQVLVVIAPPANLIVYSAETSVCSNDMGVMLFAIPAGGTWSGPGVTGTNFSPTVAGAGNHVLTYSYTDQYGCTNTATTSINVNACVGITEATGLNGISIYPNPNDGTFTFNVSTATISSVKMDIIDLQGRIVYSEMISGINAGFSKQINLTTLANGSYYLRFSSENSTSTEKLIIQH